MKVNGIPTRSIWSTDNGQAVVIIDQTQLPYRFETKEFRTWQEVKEAIERMQVRGSSLLGIAGAWAMVLAMKDVQDDEGIHRVRSALIATRPIVAELQWGVDQVVKHVLPLAEHERFVAGVKFVERLTQANVIANRAIGEYGAQIIAQIYAQTRKPVNILTHGDPGWLGTVDYGSALSPVYIAFEKGIPLHVWVDETRPRNQGLLTSWELSEVGVPHTLICDNAGGLLMQQRAVDLVLVGAARVTKVGDIAAKVGTYLKALAAYDTDVPFYAVASTGGIDWTMSDGLHEIEIEQRDCDELRYVKGLNAEAEPVRIQLLGENVSVENPAFDITPARLITGLITERGVCSAQNIAQIYS